MKIILNLLLILSVFLSSCASSKFVSNTYNKEVEMEDEKLLLGPVDRDGFELTEYKTWFDTTYHSYSTDPESIDKLKVKLNGVHIKVFLGTWCTDSQMHIPALFKILDEAKFRKKNLDMIAIDRTKENPIESLEGYEIDYVPTIIILKKEKEIGRIIESPIISLEKDILEILR